MKSWVGLLEEEGGVWQGCRDDCWMETKLGFHALLLSRTKRNGMDIFVSFSVSLPVAADLHLTTVRCPCRDGQ